MADVRIRKIDETTFEVSVLGVRPTVHIVTVAPAYATRLTGGRVPLERLLARSFDFLLAREPNTSILGCFDLSVIARYFPDYERVIPTMLD